MILHLGLGHSLDHSIEIQYNVSFIHLGLLSQFYLEDKQIRVFKKKNWQLALREIPSRSFTAQHCFQDLAIKTCWQNFQENSTALFLSLTFNLSMLSITNIYKTYLKW